MTTKSVIHAQIKFLTIIGVVIYFVIAEFHEISPNKKYWDEHNACNYYCKKENFDDPKELLGCIKGELRFNKYSKQSQKHLHY
ncbi:hypothetical protein HN51_009986 [Arachis hypogaea]